MPATMESDVLVLVIVVLAALASAFFTAVPLLPGAIFVPIGAAACAVFEVGWDEFAWWFWVAQALLVVTYLLVDNVAQLLGVKRVGGSRQAMIGGAVGVFVGPVVLALVFGPFALFLGPPIGAVAGTIVGEERSRRSAGVTDVDADADRPGYRRLGLGALMAYVVSTVIKLGLVAIQVALLAAMVIF